MWCSIREKCKHCHLLSSRQEEEGKKDDLRVVQGVTLTHGPWESWGAVNSTTSLARPGAGCKGQAAPANCFLSHCIPGQMSWLKLRARQARGDVGGRASFEGVHARTGNEACLLGSLKGLASFAKAKWSAFSSLHGYRNLWEKLRIAWVSMREWPWVTNFTWSFSVSYSIMMLFLHPSSSSVPHPYI